ncbi:hypothetical protein [Neobacillus jeddahensis]|uniref:hypothetical protein n=1 Tax=Neobacillus jeddahensis TaxID=1461580 RepID=UPI00058F8198|nr:hypothetical protein [Neobacillus jeddahensis]
MNKKALVVSGMAALLTFGGLAGCGDGIDQDNGISDGEQKDAVDQDTKEKAEDTKKDANDSLKEAKENLKDIQEDVETELEEHGVGDGVDQDNGISDGEKKDEVDNE